MKKNEAHKPLIDKEKDSSNTKPLGLSKHLAMIKDFENMTENAELNALSRLSAYSPLTDKQHKRMVFLFNKLKGGDS